MLFTHFYKICVFEAPFSMDPEVFKDLVQKEVKRIQGELIEFAKYLRAMKVRRNWYNDRLKGKEKLKFKGLAFSTPLREKEKKW